MITPEDMRQQAKTLASSARHLDREPIRQSELKLSAVLWEVCAEICERLDGAKTLRKE